MAPLVTYLLGMLIARCLDAGGEVSVWSVMALNLDTKRRRNKEETAK